MGFLRRLTRGSSGGRSSRPHGKPGARTYAIGDIHGCLDLLKRLLDKIERDVAARSPRQTYIVFLGDLIDRGPNSAGVVEFLRSYRPSFATPVFLGGNHEEILLRVLGGEPDILPDWLKFGGSECVESYGLDPSALKRLAPEEAAELVRARVPQSHVDFIEGFADTFRFGDYLFVHAGIRPGVELEQQDQFDLRWIREPFLSCEDEHGCVVVHGHTIVTAVEELDNRIGLDTGAYQTGVLTALCIEDAERRYHTAELASALSAGDTT